MNNTEILELHSALVRSRLRHHIRVLRKVQADYDAEVTEWYTSGDGASSEWVEAGTQDWFNPEYDDPSRQVNIGGRGYRYPYCIHGTSLWTDYDNICGGCEDSTPLAQVALDLAQHEVITFQRRLDWFTSKPANLPHELAQTLTDWVIEPIK